MRNPQVIVVGAGGAGLCAALAAARNGAQTMLVEYQGYVGGLSAVLPWLGFHDREYRLVVKGLPLEIVRRLEEQGAASEFVYDIKCLSAVSLDSAMWRCLAMAMLREAGVKLLLQTQVVDALREGDRVAGVVVENKSGRSTLRADTVIDCTGDGDVAARAGVAFEKGRTSDGLVQTPTLAFKLGRVDRDAFIAGCKDPALAYREWYVPYPDLWEKMMRRIDRTPVIICGGFAPLIAEARRQGKFHVPQTRIVGVKLHRDDEFLAAMTRVLGFDPTDADSLTEAAQRMYEQIPELLAFLREFVPGFRDAYVREIPPTIGVRESRRIMGDYVLNADDLAAGRRFDDAVAMGGYHMDIHRPSGTWVESRNVRAYTIPLRSLIARDVEGLMMAGKCLSATHEALAGTRVAPICMAQGQAAGTAAALAVRRGGGVREVPIEAVQEQLAAQGAEFGPGLGEPNREAIEEVGQLPLDEPETTGEGDAASADSAAWLR